MGCNCGQKRAQLNAEKRRAMRQRDAKPASEPGTQQHRIFSSKTQTPAEVRTKATQD